MALQNGNLGLIGLGTIADTPPNSIQPPLVDGIHLRWTFAPQQGFPSHGFYLFRRLHNKPVPNCLSKMTRNLAVGLKMSELDLPHFGRITSDRNLTFTEDFGPAASPEFDLDGRGHLRIRLAQENTAHWIEVQIGFRQKTQIQITAFEAETTSAQIILEGQAGEIKSAQLQADAISAVEVSGGPAALIDLCLEPVFTNATVGWEPLPKFPYPMSLPLTHPDYPASGALSEDLAAARALASSRVVYGDPDALTRVSTPLTTAGTISVVTGSPIIIGEGTSWSNELIGGVLQVDGNPSAYTIATVIGPGKLILSRAYSGVSATRLSYAVHQDGFGQLHDYLVHLVAGGSAAGPQLNRYLPSRILPGGIVNITIGSKEVVGLGTSWGPELEGLAVQVIRHTLGTVEVRDGSSLVRGIGTAWTMDLNSLSFQVDGERAAYTLIGVEPARQILILDRNYEGSTGSGRTYSIVEKTTYTIAQVFSPTQLKFDRAYHANNDPGTSYTVAYAIHGRLQPSDPDGASPAMPRQYPLDMTLLSALHPAVAQMLGLYWVDRGAEPSLTYDYLIVADYDGRFGGDPWETLRQIAATGFTDIDGYIAFNLRAEPAPPLEPPTDVQSFALPATQGLEDTVSRASNLVGLRWERAWFGPLLQSRTPVMFHVWRAAMGNNERPLLDAPYHLVTEQRPVLVAESSDVSPARFAESTPDWPPFPLTFHDPKLAEGWYGYQINGIDIFGRHSRNSTAAAWHQWTPAPEPRPWYYDDARVEPVHPSAVRLLDKTGPPAPTRIEARALDPADRYVLQDRAYHDWRESNSDVIGLRISWLWTEAHQLAAPDTTEFRIYYQSGMMNVLLGNTRRISLLSHAESLVETDIDNTQPLDTYAGTQLRCGTNTFAVLGNDGSSPLRLRVANRPPFYQVGTIALTRDSALVTGSGTNWSPEHAGLTIRVDGDDATYTVLRVENPTQLFLERVYEGSSGSGRAYTFIGVMPQAQLPCTIVFPDPHTAGTVQVVNGSPVVVGRNTKWDAKLVHSRLRVGASQTEYTIARVDSLTELTLDRAYESQDRFESPYSIRHPLFVDYSRPENWQQRLHVVGYHEHVTEISEDGVSVRRYEVFLPAPDTAKGQPFAPSLAQPLVYARIGISAADNKTHTTDDPRRAGERWGGRAGNEGSVGPRATIFRVLREQPSAPLPPPDSERVFATPADYHAHSYYTYRWRQVAHLKTHIFRALDDSVFQTDWNHRAAPHPLRRAMTAADLELFPYEWRDDSSRLRRQSVADALNQLNDFTHDDPGKERAMGYYRNLSNDALRVLAGLPGNEAAFTQLTIDPLDPEDANTFDRIGPDNPDSYRPDPNLRLYIDTLDGRSINRDFYRTAYIDGAHNRSELSLASAPVWLPDVSLPATPRLLKALGGERSITLQWSASWEADVSRYLIYRSNDKLQGRDVRLMGSPVANLPAAPLVISRGTVDMGSETDVVLIERVYDAVGFDVDSNLLTGQTATQYLRAPAAPIGTRLTGLGADDGTEVIVVYRDSRGALQRTPHQNKLNIWIDQGLRGARDYYYRIVVTRAGITERGVQIIHSRPSAIGIARAVELNPPEPPMITTLERLRLAPDGTIHSFDGPIPEGEELLPAIRLIWTSSDPTVICLVQFRSSPESGFTSASGWLPQGTNSFVHQNPYWFMAQEYRIKVLSEAGNSNTTYAPASLPAAHFDEV